MPFSHDRPRAGRVTALAAERKTDGVRTAGSIGRTVSFSRKTNYVSRTSETKHTISHAVGNGDVSTIVSSQLNIAGAGKNENATFTAKKCYTGNTQGGAVQT